MTETPMWVPVVLASLSSTVIAAVVTAVVTWRLGVKGHEREARKVELDAGDKFTGRLIERVNALEGRVDELEEKRRKDARLIREQGDHIDVLENHIWQKLPPPPPARPTGL